VLTSLAVPGFYVMIQGLSERFGGAPKAPATESAGAET
jgi:hypothetical protein